MKLNFRLHNVGKSLVIEAYPENGGVDNILRKSWNLNTVGLKSVRIPDKMDLPYGEHKIPNRKSLVRGGFRIDIDHSKELFIVYPKNRNRNILESKKIIYRFGDIGVESIDNSTDKSIEASLDSQPLDKENKFTNLDF